MNEVIAQSESSDYFQFNVKKANGDDLEDDSLTQSDVSFTAFLNGEQDSILTDDTPRWDSDEPNIDIFNSIAGVELQNFIDIAGSDSAMVRFTHLPASQQGTIVGVVDSIRSKFWFNFTLNMKQKTLPDPPQNLNLSVSDSYKRTVTWDTISGLKYDVYRRTIQDTIFNGESRHLYVRVANDLSDGSFTDPDTTSDKTFGYIVYAQNDEGNLSARSAEVIETGKITNLKITAKATTAELNWDSYDTELGQTAGYNIYRRTATTTYGKPVAFTGVETNYVDSRLDPGATYYYKVRARNKKTDEFGESSEVSVTTESNPDKYYKYATFNAAIAIFKNAEGESITEQHIKDLQRLLYFTRLFFWRHSDMKLNVDFDFYVVRDTVSLCDNDDWDTDGCNGNVYNTGQILADKFGVVNKQYDYVFRFATPTTGFWSIGVTDNMPFPELDGDSRGTGFAQITWPKLRGAGYPFEFDTIPTPPAVIWTAEHEMQHVIDAIYRFNDHEEMPHGDRPQDFTAKRFGRHYDFQAAMLEYFDAYTDLKSNWGEIYEARDADNDGFPDSDPHVSMNEKMFGSDTTSADTDGDGATDKEEQISGLYHYGTTDPHDPDSDNDGIKDGEDQYPRYPMKTTVPEFTPKVDGVIEDGWTVLNDSVSYTSLDSGFKPKLMMSYGSDSLYIAIESDKVGIPRIFFDFQADGRLFGAGNTQMRINLTDGTFNRLRTLDGRPEVREYEHKIHDRPDHIGGRPMWDTSSEYQEKFGGQVIKPGNVNLAVKLNLNNTPQMRIEMAIPRNDLAGVNPEPGWEFGLWLNYIKAGNEPREWANTFDEYSFAYFTTDGATPIENKDDQTVHSFELQQNYPNPFNPTTSIKYSIAEPGNVSLQVYNLLGQKVATLVNERQKAGYHEVTFNAKHLSSGIYFYKLDTDANTQVRKMTILK